MKKKIEAENFGIGIKNFCLTFLRGKCFCLLLPLVIFTSCLGVSADIQVRKDGSGRLNMEYTFSAMAETIGRLDGNENRQIIPVGKADWERTIQRIEGARLVSFSSREKDGNIVNKVTLEFDNMQTLLKILDPAGNRSNLIQENGKNSLRVILNEPLNSEINADLLELVRQVSSGYKVNVSFSAAGNSAMSLTDGNGNEIPAPANADFIQTGKKVSLSMDTAELLSRAEGTGLVFSW